MIKVYPYLQNSQFLKELDNYKNREQYIKITVLDFLTEDPIQEIQGITTAGNLTIDGKSAVRRTCNLTVVATENENDLTDIDNLFSLNKKIFIEVGLKNFTNYYIDYDIIWFPLGTFSVKNPSITHNLSGVNISLTLSDKMSFLNGENGGTIAASVILNEMESIDQYGQSIIKYPTIYQIILELVNHFGGEQLGRIMINNIAETARIIMKWIGNIPLYAYESENGLKLTTNINKVPANQQGMKQYSYGDDIGYMITSFTYPGELVVNQGNTICSALDTIKNTLGNFEYFYDVYGNFIFQEIKNYLNTSKATIDLEEMEKNIDYSVDLAQDKAVYTFDSSNLISSYSNTPQFSQIKNDFVIWGIRSSASGAKLPIRYHLVFDEKPAYGLETYKGLLVSNEDGLTVVKNTFKITALNNLPNPGTVGIYYDLNNKIYTWDVETLNYISLNISYVNFKSADWRGQLYLQGVFSEFQGTDSNYYYTELINEFPKMYEWVLENNVYVNKVRQEVINHPEDLDYFLDFIDTAATKKFSVNAIGRRTFSENSNDVNCIFEPQMNDIVLIEVKENNQEEVEAAREYCAEQGIDYQQIDSSLYNGLATGGSYYGAYSRVRELLYQYLSFNETITIQAIPIYHLEPNTRITVIDPVSGINGDYIINSISLSLAGGTMTINATRALERI